jgi:hypothetical protein
MPHAPGRARPGYSVSVKDSGVKQDAYLVIMWEFDHF